jgi:hypothetical protein
MDTPESVNDAIPWTVGTPYRVHFSWIAGIMGSKSTPQLLLLDVLSMSLFNLVLIRCPSFGLH